jgi:hypothetical protein
MMPKFLAIGYGDRSGYDRTLQKIREKAHLQDTRLVDEGAVMGIAGSPVQVRNPDDTGLQITTEQFLSAALPVAGFTLIEATSLEEAIQKVSGVPCAVAHGVVEIWPMG